PRDAFTYRLQLIEHRVRLDLAELRIKRTDQLYAAPRVRGINITDGIRHLNILDFDLRAIRRVVRERFGFVESLLGGLNEILWIESRLARCHARRVGQRRSNKLIVAKEAMQIVDSGFGGVETARQIFEIRGDGLI